MTPTKPRAAALATIATVSLGLTACASSTGGSGSTGSSTSGGTAVKGGTLNLLGSGAVDYMDPNISYYSIGYLGLRPWSRQLFTYPAVTGQTTKAVPDIATTLPSDGNGISADGKTYTIKLRQGVK